MGQIPDLLGWGEAVRSDCEGVPRTVADQTGTELAPETVPTVQPGHGQRGRVLRHSVAGGRHREDQ